MVGRALLSQLHVTTGDDDDHDHDDHDGYVEDDEDGDKDDNNRNIGNKMLTMTNLMKVLKGNTFLHSILDV